MKILIITLTILLLLMPSVCAAADVGAWRMLKVEATAFTADPNENGGYNTTHMGDPLEGNIVASDDLPYGTRLLINDKLYIVKGIFGGGFKNRIDILVASKEEAWKFGRQIMTVYVVGVFNEFTHSEN